MNENEQDNHDFNFLKFVNGIQTNGHYDLSYYKEHLFGTIIHHFSPNERRNYLQNTQKNDNHVRELLIFVCDF